MNYQQFCENKPIRDVRLDHDKISDFDMISIYLKDSGSMLEIYAWADCCSSSWFYFFKDKPIESIIGKIIKSIDFVKDIELPPSGIQEFDENHLFQFTFTDDTNYQFVLRNSSNGYYDGWIEIRVKSFLPEPRVSKLLQYTS